MSGGSWNYLCDKVDDAGGELCSSSDPLRRAFGRHLLLVGKALHDIEWVDSCDYGKGDEVEAIKAALPNAEQEVLQETLDAAKKICGDLLRLIAEAEEK